MLGKQPSTIDGYRSPIVDKLGNSPFNISKDGNLARLLDSFLRDRPKRQEWHTLLEFLTGRAPAKTPFDPIKKAPLKHLTFKTVFLLALGSGKCKVRFMPGKTDILDTNPIGHRCPCIHHPAFCPRISWP